MKFFKKIELEWKIVAVGALLFIGFIGPVPYFISRVNTSLTGSVDPQVEQLLRLQVASPDSAIAHQAVASLERQRQWFAMLPIVRGEQQRSFFYFSLVLFGLFLILAIWTVKRLTQPLRNLAHAAEQIGRGEAVQIESGSGGALGRLEYSMSIMQKELADLRGRAEAAGMEQAWRDIARVMAHEIKNPLTPIRLTLDRLGEKLLKSDTVASTEVGAGLDRIGAQVDNLERLVNSFRSFAREPEVRLRPMALAEVVTRIGTDMQAGCATSVVGDAQISGDPYLFNQIMLNIFKNAVEAGADKVAVTIRQESSAVLLSIADNGPGLAPDLLPQIWVPYVTFKKGGTGLGLAVVKRLVESMTGSAWVSASQDERDHGLTIHMKFPMPLKSGTRG